MNPVIEVKDLSKTFGKVVALDSVSLSFEGPGIHGLLGRNGAGKTTLMNLLTGQDFASRGSAHVFGQTPGENSAVLSRVSLTKESQTYPEDFKGKHALKAASWAYPHWDDAFAQQLVEEFRVPLNTKVKKMSRGQRSALGAIVGLAARAELAFFDEPYAGLDAVARQLFYDRLLEDYALNPRTIILSTHLIDEAANLLERIVLIEQGRIVVNEDSETLRGSAVAIVGPADLVEVLTAGAEVISVQRLGKTMQATVVGLSAEQQQAAISAGLELGSVSLQQLVIHRTQSISAAGAQS